jgi:hypothetical protein
MDAVSVKVAAGVHAVSDLPADMVAFERPLL